MVKSNNYGFPISLVLHLIILAMPVSMVVSKHFKEIEIFIIDDTPVVEKIAEVKKTIKEPVKKPLPPEPVVEKKVEPEVKQEPIIEPVMLTEEKAIVSLPQRVEKPNVEVSPVIVEETKKERKPLIVATEAKKQYEGEFGSESGPKFLHREMPVYPLMARRLGKEGRVLLRLTIDENGKLLNVEVIEGAGYGFTEAAVRAVKRSTFLPAAHNGRPVMSKALLPIRFNLRRE